MRERTLRGLVSVELGVALGVEVLDGGGIDEATGVFGVSEVAEVAC